MTELNVARTGLEDVEEALKDVIDPEPVSYTHLTLPTILLV